MHVRDTFRLAHYGTHLRYSRRMRREAPEHVCTGCSRPTMTNFVFATASDRPGSISFYTAKAYPDFPALLRPTTSTIPTGDSDKLIIHLEREPSGTTVDGTWFLRCSERKNRVGLEESRWKHRDLSVLHDSILFQRSGCDLILHLSRPRRQNREARGPENANCL